MPQSKWTIHSTTGGGDGTQLAGYKIVQNSAGTGYDFTKPDGTTVLASITAAAPPPSFTFPAFTLGLWSWTITVSSLANPAAGGWTNTDPNPTGEEGTWSAGAGADDDAEESKSSAYA